MARSNRSARRWRLTLLWVALLSMLVRTSTAAQSDDCERYTSTGETRDCTYLEEMRECVDDANDSFDDCWEDAGTQDSLVARLVNYAGCEEASLENLTACAVGVSTGWALGDLL